MMDAMAGNTHYHVQKRRRAEFIEEWSKNYRTIVHHDEANLVDTARRMRRGVFIGQDGARPSRSIDATLHEIDPGVTSTVHRHSWDAMVLCVSGWGWTTVDDTRIDWGPGDALHLPAWSWHRHGNEGDEVARFISTSSEPLLETMGMAILEEGGDSPQDELPPRPSYASSAAGSDPYAERIRRLADEQATRRKARLHTSWDDVQLVRSPRGQRTAFLLDRSIGYGASGLSMVVAEMAPGRGQRFIHRHPGEAWLYVLEGHGHSILGTELDNVYEHTWSKGDLIIVDHFLWHQHFNDDKQNTAKLVRMHMFDSLLETMRALCYPLVLFEEGPEDPAGKDEQADQVDAGPSHVSRPTWP
jgi:gentisate 1,2-dioxygenase